MTGAFNISVDNFFNLSHSIPMKTMSFEKLINTIQTTHMALMQQAVRAVNSGLTLRNWLIGLYIVEFEQKGEDRAIYGTALLDNLAKQINIKGLTPPELSRCRQFYKTYTEILGTMSQKLLPADILGTLPQELNLININEEGNSGTNIIYRISYSHFTELIKIDDPLKRQYYELLILKTNLNVRELKRQIASLCYERLGLSANKEKALEQISNNLIPLSPEDAVKSHYFFEFLNIISPELIEETNIEQAMLNHLQQFILELGNGFCFEARQKRILIGDEYYFADLVFYHRILKCHIIIELKVDSFNHSHASQLITYLNYFKKNQMEEGDNPPIGILLVTDKNTALVEYATASDRDRVFVSKYKFKLPKEDELKLFIEKELSLLQ